MSQLRIMDYNYIFDSTVGLTASTAEAAFPISNLRHYHRSKVWRTTSTASQYAVIDLRTPEEINSFVMVFDHETNPTFSAGATFSLQANPVNTWSSPALTVVPTIDAEKGIVSWFSDTAYEYRYWRLVPTDSAASLGYFEISKMYLGLATQLTQMPEIGFTPSLKDRSRVLDNDYGHEYSDTYPSRAELELTWAALSEADKNTLKEIYNRLGKVKPLFLAMDPLQAIFSDKDNYIYYGFLDNDFEPEQVFYTFFDVEMRLREAM